MRKLFFVLICMVCFLTSCDLIEKEQQDLTKRLKATDWTHGDYFYKDSDGVYRKHNEKLNSCVFGNILRFDADSVKMEDPSPACSSTDPNVSYWVGNKKYKYQLSSDNRSLDIIISSSKTLSFKVEAYNENELNLSPKDEPNSVIFYKRLKDFK